VLRVQRDLKVQSDQQAQLVHKVLRDHKEFQGKLEKQDQRVRKGHKDLSVLKE
jgi:hypothetical protein